MLLFFFAIKPRQLKIFLIVTHSKYDKLEFLKTFNKHLNILEHHFLTTPIDTNVTETGLAGLSLWKIAQGQQP